MKRSRLDNAKKSKKMGRPPVDSEAVTVRMTVDALRSLDDWRRGQHDLPGRPEAIRQLVELGLTVKVRPRQPSRAHAVRAKEMAAKTIDSLIDPAASTEEVANRKRRLLKGPEEFREARVDCVKKT